MIQDALPAGARAALLRLAPLLVVAVTVLPAACCTVTVYEPLRGLQRPVIVDAAADNFAGSRVYIRCFTNADMPPGDADKVCRNLATVLRQQGAETETTVPRDAGGAGGSFDGNGPDLIVDVDSKIEHEYDYPALAAISGLTLTLIPAIDEQTYTQRVVVRGRDGSVLVSDSFRARFVNYTGIAIWSINWLLDWLVRDDAQDMSGDAPKKDFSRDFYQQTAQLTFNARVRSDVLGLTLRAPSTASEAPLDPVPTAAPTPTTAPTTPVDPASAPTTTTPATPPTTAPANSADPAEAPAFNY